MALWIKCKGASELASRAVDENLPFSARFALRFHQLVCHNCARCAAQVKDIRRLLHLEQSKNNRDAASLSREAMQRIESELR